MHSLRILRSSDKKQKCVEQQYISCLQTPASTGYVPVLPVSVTLMPFFAVAGPANRRG
jgi:hypothetical protein